MPATRTFLIVDDNEDNRFLAGYALRKTFPGARILETAQIDEALRLARQEAPDGIVTDHHLGVVDGSDFVRDLVAAGVRCPVIMVTASSDPAVHRRAYEAGAIRVFSGPQLDFARYFESYFRAAEEGR